MPEKTKNKTKAPARNATRRKNEKPSIDEEFLNQFDDDSWNCVAGGEKREGKKKKKMNVSGKSVFKIKEIINKKK